MAQPKTYQSLYGADSLITISQYISELIIQRQATFRKVKLPNKFWKDKSYAEWTKTLRLQKMRADALCKSGYDYIIILKALNTDKGKYIASLYNKKLELILEEESRKADSLAKVEQKVNLEVTKTDIVSTGFSSKKTTFSKLRD